MNPRVGEINDWGRDGWNTPTERNDPNLGCVAGVVAAVDQALPAATHFAITSRIFSGDLHIRNGAEGPDLRVTMRSPGHGLA
jgi:hypothetical protein